MKSPKTPVLLEINLNPALKGVAPPLFLRDLPFIPTHRVGHPGRPREYIQSVPTYDVTKVITIYTKTSNWHSFTYPAPLRLGSLLDYSGYGDRGKVYSVEMAACIALWIETPLYHLPCGYLKVSYPILEIISITRQNHHAPARFIFYP